MARVIHESSSRHKGPFVAFNCAALPENLAEDMLFGHEKGSFTGALSSQAGLFEQAQGGTILLSVLTNTISNIACGYSMRVCRIRVHLCIYN